jgi:hypothetical protein
VFLLGGPFPAMDYPGGEPDPNRNYIEAAEIRALIKYTLTDETKIR